jgi:hypothetical protein
MGGHGQFRDGRSGQVGDPGLAHVGSGSIELHLDVFHEVRQVPALDGVVARRLRGGGHEVRVHRRLGQTFPGLDQRRHDHRHHQLAILTHRTLVEVEGGHGEDAGAVVDLHRFQVFGKDFARVLGGKLEERAHRIPIPVDGY